MQRIILLGATGSIGDQTLNIVSRYPEEFRVVGMSAKRNAEKLLERVDQFDVEAFFLMAGHTGDERQVETLDELLGTQKDYFDHLIVADHGLTSCKLVLEALAMKKRVSIANKELLIVHGEDIMYFAREQQAEIIPLDSEHNALFQCLQGERISDVRRLIITASGGPFRDKSPEELKRVTVDQVLKHPNWTMGRKTTVDSATLVNKAFEVIETHHLFGIPYERIEVRLHPESIVHAIVEFNDGSSKLLGYKPDMRFSIGYSLFYPQRAPASLTGSDDDYFDYDHDLQLSRIDEGSYPCFDAILDSARTKPQSLAKLVENDARAVEMFLEGEIGFTEIKRKLQEGI